MKLTAKESTVKTVKKENKFKFTQELSSKEKASLKGLAHSLKALVQIGGNGISEGVITQISTALELHELIKIQLPGNSDSDTKTSETENLIKKLGKYVHLVGRIGRTVILYKEKDPANGAKITLKSL